MILNIEFAYALLGETETTKKLKAMEKIPYATSIIQKPNISFIRFTRRTTVTANITTKV